MNISKKITLPSLVVLVGFVVLCGLLVALRYQPPRLAQLSVADRSISFYVNKPLSVEPKLSFSPEIEFTLSKNGPFYTVNFISEPYYDTTYTMSASLTSDNKLFNDYFTFKTKPVEYIYIARNGGQSDEVVKISGNERGVLYSGGKITHSSYDGKNSVCIVEEASKQNQIKCIDLFGKTNLNTQLDSGYSILDFHAAEDKIIFSILGNSLETHGRLFMLSRLTNEIKEVINNQGKQYQLNDFRLSLDGNTVFGQNIDKVGILLDPSTPSSAQVLEEIEQIGNFSTDGQQVSFANEDNIISSVDSNGSRYPLENSGGYFEHYLETTNSFTGLRRFTSPTFAGSAHGLFLYAINSSSLVYEVDTTKSVLSALNLSKNHELISFEQSSLPLSYDDYKTNTKHHGVETVIINKNGQIYGRFYGVDLEFLN